MEQALAEQSAGRREEPQASFRRTDPMPIGSAVRSLTPLLMDKPERCSRCSGEMKRLPMSLGGVPYCPACAARDAEADDRQRREAEERERREQTKRAQIRRYLADSCLGERFVGKTFGDYHPVCPEAHRALEECRVFAAEFVPGSGRNLILVGSPGTGKNMLSAIIGQEVMARGSSFLHTSAVKVVRRFKDSWKIPGATEEEVLRYFVAPDLLVIDEIGVQFGTPTEKLYLTEVINDRYEAKRSTILLSNLTMKQVEEVIGARGIDRFHEDGSRVLVFAWPSYRRQK